MNYPLLSKIYLILCWVLFIFILIVIPIPSVGESTSFTLYDKFFHFFIFGGLAVLAGGLFYKQKKISRFYFNLLIFILISGYVLLTEYIQHFTPTRDPCLWDGLGGISGIVIGLLFVNSYWNRPENKE